MKHPAETRRKRMPKTEWDGWRWIGGSGGGHAFAFKDADMDDVPKWVRNVVFRMEKEDELLGAGYDHNYYELVGSTYRYRIVPFVVETGQAAVSVYRSGKVYKGKWYCGGDPRWGELKDIRHYWDRIGWRHCAPWSIRYAVRSVLGWVKGGEYRMANLQDVPAWVQEVLGHLVTEHGDLTQDGQSTNYYQLIGRKYVYRIVPDYYEPENGRIDIYRSKRTSS